MTKQSIERLERPTPGEFHRRFVRKNRPVVITGVADSWKAINRWSPDYFRSSFADAKVSFTAWESTNPVNDPTDYYENRRRLGTRLGNFIDLMKTEQDFSRNYITQFSVFREIPMLREDVEPLDEYTRVPAAMRSRFTKPPTMWLGPAHTVTPVHFDGADNLLVQIFGRKKLTLIPPAQSEKLYYPCLRLGHVHYSPVDVEDPDFEQFPKFKDATLFEVTLEPGEILFIPVRWWHHARSLETAISLNFWWYSMRSLFRMRHPYFVFQKDRVAKKLLNVR